MGGGGGGCGGGGSGARGGNGSKNSQGSDGKNGGNGAGGGGKSACGSPRKDGGGCPQHHGGSSSGAASHGDPIDVITGRVFTAPVVDLDLPGPLPLEFAHSYSTGGAGVIATTTMPTPSRLRTSAAWCFGKPCTMSSGAAHRFATRVARSPPTGTATKGYSCPWKSRAGRSGGSFMTAWAM
ncbi:DUF6531 domain-containing protein [Sorangium sp. So ce834]|uniref:DUF6531 domain-containing protein n=1 Tax=Sorangium sp. So ce834 TaxID=3133321 RepID=UPI003F60359E